MSRCYVYGRGEAAISALLRDPAFAHLLGGLFAGEVARPSDAAQEEAAARAVGAGLLRGGGSGYTPGPRLVVVPRQASREAAERMGPALDRYGEVVGSAAAELRIAFERTSAAGSLPWPRVEHALVAGMLLDLSVGSQLWLHGHIHRACDETLVWAFEETPGHNAFGVQWMAADSETAGLAQLWHRGLERADLRVTSLAVAALVRLALGDTRPLPPRERLLLRYLGLIDAGPDGDRSTVAAFSAHEMDELLLPVLWCSAERLLAEGVLPALEAGCRADWWSHRVQADTVHHALVRTVLELGTDRVVATGGMAPFPSGHAPADWGRWLWAEHPGDRTLVAGAFEEATSQVRRRRAG